MHEQFVCIGVASGMAGRALALPIIPPERDIAAHVMIELFAEYSLAHVIITCVPNQSFFLCYAPGMSHMVCI